MSELDLNALSKEDLLDLQGRIAAQLERRNAERLARARMEVERIAREAGVSLPELLSRPAKSSRRSKLPAKYRHPENPELTWVGRGKRPAWYTEALAAGMSKEDLRIESPAPVS